MIFIKSKLNWEAGLADSTYSVADSFVLPGEPWCEESLRERFIQASLIFN